MPYWRLSSFYFFFFACLGALLPYWSIYLHAHGFSAYEIGLLWAIHAATKVVAPNIWGWIADHTGRRMAVVRLGSLLAAICFAGVFFDSGFAWMAGVMFLFSFFWNAVLPPFEATTLRHLGLNSHKYTHIRLWGSLGFIASVAGLGLLFDAASVEMLPPIVAALFVAIWLSSLAVPEPHGTHPHGDHEPWGRLLRRPEVVALLAICLLMQASHGPYYTFFTVYLEGHGYSRTIIGQLWALGVVAEIGVFLVMHRLVQRFTLPGLMALSLGLATLRWAMIGGFPDTLWILLAAQTLHAASFGTYHAVAIALFHRYFQGPHHSKGQALYSSISYGVGGALGSFLAGIAWESTGDSSVFYLAAALSGAGLLVAWRFWLLHPREESEGGAAPG